MAAEASGPSRLTSCCEEEVVESRNHFEISSEQDRAVNPVAPCLIPPSPPKEHDDDHDVPQEQPVVSTSSSSVLKTRPVLQQDAPLEVCAICFNDLVAEFPAAGRSVVVESSGESRGGENRGDDPSDDVLRSSTQRLRCRHVFCRECIERWLRTSPTCPVCRVRLLPDHAESSPDAGAPTTLLPESRAARHVMVRLRIPGRCVGRVIGRRGAVKRDIERCCCAASTDAAHPGVRLFINPGEIAMDKRPLGDATVLFVGDAGAVAMAKARVEAIVGRATDGFGGEENIDAVDADEYSGAEEELRRKPTTALPLEAFMKSRPRDGRGGQKARRSNRALLSSQEEAPLLPATTAVVLKSDEGRCPESSDKGSSSCSTASYDHAPAFGWYSPAEQVFRRSHPSRSECRGRLVSRVLSSKASSSAKARAFLLSIAILLTIGARPLV